MSSMPTAQIAGVYHRKVGGHSRDRPQRWLRRYGLQYLPRHAGTGDCGHSLTRAASVAAARMSVNTFAPRFDNKTYLVDSGSGSSIAVIGWDQSEIGRIPVGMLRRQIGNRHNRDPYRVPVPSEFVPRASVTPPACAP